MYFSTTSISKVSQKRETHFGIYHGDSRGKHMESVWIELILLKLKTETENTIAK